MNCEQGDLAVIVRSENFPQYVGRIVTCLKFEPIQNEWEIDLVVIPGATTYAYDHCLRPLRDNPGQDETLSWAPVPSKLKEKA